MDKMTRREPQYDVGSGKELREKYGLAAKNRPVTKLDATRVPVELRGLIPYAEAWGEGDDLIRAELIEQANYQSLQDLVAALEQFDREILSVWLAGPQADVPSEMTAEYLAFSALRLAYEEAKVRLKYWKK